MKRYFRLYRAFFRICLMREMEARGSLMAMILVIMFLVCLPLVFVGALYSRVPSLGGWSLYQFLLMVGTYQIIAGIVFSLFSRNMFQFLELVREGKLDFYLLKPVNSQFMLSTRYILFYELPGAIVGICLIGYSLNHLQLHIDWWRWPLYLLFIVSGVIIAYSIWFCAVIPCIWWIKLDSPEMFFSVLNVPRYHPSMFSTGMRLFLTYGLPVGVIVATPADLLLDRLTFTAGIWSLLVSGLCLLISAKFWQYALHHYNGASS